MHIKQIIIQGFKSYRDQTVIEPFSPHHNVVVGRNGSGKSNFFSAIRFVLNDAYTKMGQEERQALLHEGVSTLAMTTFVEVIFDNTDHRFPTGKDEVVLKRAIGLKKDEYYLDHKAVPKADIVNLLQSAGFSKANPYYIVPQGRVTALTNAKDTDRLEILKDVAGTKVYEEHRVESLKIISETKQKREKIQELLDLINEKIEGLEEEKEELVEFTRLDKEKRSLEYNVYTKEQNDIASALASLEETYASEFSGLSADRRHAIESERKLTASEHALVEAQQNLEILNGELSHLVAQKREDLQAKTKTEMQLHDTLSKSNKNGELYKTLKKELAAIEEQVRDKQASAADLESALKEKLSAEEDALSRTCQLSAQKESLLLRQGRSSQFDSAAERDSALAREMDVLREKMQYEDTKQARLNGEMERIRDEIKALDDQAQANKDRKAQIQKELGHVEAELFEKLKQRDKLCETRKQCWREESKLDTLLPPLREELLKQERHIYATLDKNTSYGLESVRRICQSLNISGVHGPVYELFSIDDIYTTAVELVAGQSLFNIVVDHDAVATQILDVMTREKSGRVTFIPLNRLKVKETAYPKDQSQGFPMLSILQFDPQYTSVIKQIFGKAYIVQSLEVGAAVSRPYDLNAITMDGDRVDRKGALTGGYIDSKTSRLNAIKQFKTLQSKSMQYEDRLVSLKSELSVLDQQITQLMGHVHSLEAAKAKHLNEMESLQYQMAEELQIHAQKLSSMSEKQRATRHAELEKTRCESSMTSLEKEIGTKLASKPSKEELSGLQRATAELEALKLVLANLTREKTALLSELNEHKNALAEHFIKRKGAIQDKLAEMERERLFEVEEELGLENQILAERIQDHISKEKTMAREKDELAQKMDKINKEIEKLKSNLAKESKRTDGSESFLAKYMSKKNALEAKKEACVRKIRELGLIPEDALTKYTSVSVSTMVKRLHTLNSKLKDFAHVNKKALEQYDNFTKQRTILTKRKQELDASAQSIVDFIDHLDAQKDEAVQRTFDQVSQYFTDIFERLVPTGRAELVMQRNLAALMSVGAAAQPSQSQKLAIPSVEGVSQYTGIGIQVSFNSKTNKAMRMQQLSGGQKSIVSLALIFAIQKCDPAPFYLFDEIDANLDAAYRASVAGLIRELSRTQAQFIVTTFRPEMLVSADKFYGVTFENRKSRIHAITKEAAFEFIEQDDVENAASAVDHALNIKANQLEPLHRLETHGGVDSDGDAILAQF